jgi:hypothetical protein
MYTGLKNLPTLFYTPHGKSAPITSFKYQVYMYGYGTITYSKPILSLVTEPALYKSNEHQTTPTHPPATSAYPILNGSITFTIMKRTQLIYSQITITHFKNTGKTIIPKPSV